MKTATTLTVLSFILIASLANAANITGAVMYDGDAPARAAMKATKDQHCIDNLANGKSEALVVSKGKGIKKRCSLFAGARRDPHAACQKSGNGSGQLYVLPACPGCN